MAEVNNSNLSYTSRDYESILKELINTIPLLNSDWTAREESDPGIVLIKLMAMVGDMLSYNLDKQALELYPESVTQRKNAYQIYNLLGYKMHWYKSARCRATLLLSGNNSGLKINRYSKFSTLDGKIFYTNLKDIEISAGQQSKSIELIQGIAKTPAMKNTNIIADKWYNNYEFNLSANDFVDNKYYFTDSAIEQDTIVLCDNTGEWILVEDIDLVTDINKSYYGNKYYDFRVDEYDRPYIRLCQSWNDNNQGPQNFKLFYLISAGASGAVSSGSLKSNNYYIASMTNEKSTLGYDPETPSEAWINSRNWVNTNNTLITCNDFTKAVRRIEGVANAIALDWMTDVQDPIETNMKNYEVRIYVVPDSEFINSTAQSASEATIQLYEKINKYIKSNKILHLLNMTYWDKQSLPSGSEISSIPNSDVIQHYKWQIEGIIYYRTPLNKADSDELISLINNTLKLRFNLKNLDFNQSIKYINVVNEILRCDSRILYVDLKPIVYRDSTGNIVSEEQLTGKHVIEIAPNNLEEGGNPCLYEIDLTKYTNGYSIKPSSISIKIETGNFTIYDDGNGKLVSGIVDGENSIIANSNGTVDYGRYSVITDKTLEELQNLPEQELKDGRIAKVNDLYYKYENNEWSETDLRPGLLRFELRYATASPIIVSFKTNQLAIAEYENLDPEKFYASADSLKRKG